MKSPFKIGLAALAVSLVFAAGYAKGQDGANAQDWERRFTRFASRGDATDANKLADLIREAVGNSTLTNSLSKMAFQCDTRAEPRETTLAAMQVAQNQKIIEQNERIIQLLEQQQKGK